jgi:transposase
MNVESLRRWAALYRVHGAAGVQERRQRRIKLLVWQRMRDEELSYRQVAAFFNIRNFNIIGDWERAYDEGSVVALSPCSPGRRTRMTKQSTNEPQSSSSEEAGRAAVKARIVLEL